MTETPHASLKPPGSVLLLSCYELGHIPMGLASPAAFLEAAGYRPASQDLTTSRLDADLVRQARFVGISVPMHTALRLGMSIASRVRALNPTCHICFYGLYASLNEQVLLGDSADSVIGAEYEPALVSLVQALESGDDADLEGVSRPGRLNAPRVARTRFVPPARDNLPPLERYARVALPASTRTVGYVEASRGCKHRCAHCPLPPVYNGRFFVVPGEVVLTDVARLVERGAGHITFGDPDFLNGPRHAQAIVEALHQRFPHLTYDFTAKVEHLLQQETLLPLFARTGCLFIVSAVESLSDPVLAALNKGHTRSDVLRALDLTRRVGIALRPTFVAFTPWTTAGDYLYLLRFIARSGLIHHVDVVQYAIRLLVPPGSALVDSPRFKPFQGPLDAQALTYRWVHPDPAMDALQQRVVEIVEAAAQSDTPTEQTFRRILQEAVTTAGEDGDSVPLLADLAHHPVAPRLTEPWFC